MWRHDIHNWFALRSAFSPTYTYMYSILYTRDANIRQFLSETKSLYSCKKTGAKMINDQLTGEIVFQEKIFNFHALPSTDLYQ